ncbi:MAG: hypothetical protein PHO12_07235 [Bacteroidales bacterium]|nr:hypothetical protein [Bacteroidales bacterium]MDD4683956.1 hypothetical protein [Bacteroidales bacterium]
MNDNIVYFDQPADEGGELNNDDAESKILSQYLYYYSENISDDEKVDDLVKKFGLTRHEIKQILLDSDVNLRTSTWMRRRRYRNYEKMPNNNLYGIYSLLVTNLRKQKKEELLEQDAFNMKYETIQTIIDLEDILSKRIKEGNSIGLELFLRDSKALHKLEEDVLALKK